MNKFLTSILVATVLVATVLVAGIFALMPVEKVSTAGGRSSVTESDHGLVDVASGEKGFCGSTGEPWTLYIAAASDSDGGSVKLTFNDGDSITYPVAADDSFSAQFAFGGVPGVDNVVRVEGTGIPAMVVSAQPTGNFIDPFDEDDDGILNDPKPPLPPLPPNERDNYCVVDPSEMDVEEDGVSGDTFGDGNTIIGVD